MTDPIKAEQLTSVKWRVLSIPYYGPKDGKDTDGEYFSPRTDIKSDWFPTRPVLFHHAQDEMVKDESLGTEDDLKQESDGWWGTMWLDRSNRYWAQISDWLAKGKLYGSSGALGHLVKKANDGEILVWPHIEQTLTLTPANPFARVVPAKAATTFKEAGLVLPSDLMDLEQPTPDLSPEDGDEAARQRLQGEVARLEELIKQLKR